MAARYRRPTATRSYRHGRGLFMHNGYLNEIATVKRELSLAVDSRG